MITKLITQAYLLIMPFELIWALRSFGVGVPCSKFCSCFCIPKHCALMPECSYVCFNSFSSIFENIFCSVAYFFLACGWSYSLGTLFKNTSLHSIFWQRSMVDEREARITDDFGWQLVCSLLPTPRITLLTTLSILNLSKESWRARPVDPRHWKWRSYFEWWLGLEERRIQIIEENSKIRWKSMLAMVFLPMHVC